MAYEIIKHTADLRIRVTAGTAEELFKEAAFAMGDILKKEIPGDAAAVEREITVSSPDRTALLVDFLSEILSLSHINKEAYKETAIEELSDFSVKARVKGRKVNYFDEDIKAATYHEADVRQNKAGQWETILVFDI